jgi:hypothetical protein
MTKRFVIQLDDANETWLVSLREHRAADADEAVDDEAADVEEAADIVRMHRSEGLGYEQALVQLRTLGCSKEEAEKMLLPTSTA